MTYSQLLLSTGGGIISQTQQAEQVENTATVLIGLGGTGVDCLKEIKKAVRERLTPDDPEALVPTYNHIRFLAVDTDTINGGLELFDSSEIFDISNSDVKGALKKKSVISARRELDWLDSDKVNTADIGDAGAGGFRQAGRYMLMDQSNRFLDQVKSHIRNAKMGAGRTSLYIHLFSGLGGGTGSGTFLDACYLVRKAIDEEAGGNGKLFGYFFLPDVNLSKIPDSASLVKDYIPRNGYAAMQELEYCMRMGENGDGFTQIYKGGKAIDWKEAPVDMCHLICATDKNRIVVANAYQNAMLVTTEYVMDFLTKPVSSVQAGENESGIQEAEKGEADSEFSLKSHLSNFTAQVMAADGIKEHGYNLRYCVIGASCASIPMREINTYLTSKVFEGFSVISGRVPTENEVQKLAVDAKISTIDSLLLEISKGANGDLAMAPDYLDWTFVRDNGDKDLVNHYTDQKADQVGTLEKNAQSMMDEKNTQSLISRVCEQLDACARDLNRGSAYALGTVNASSKVNLLNYVGGLQENIKSRISQKHYEIYEQPEGSRRANYENSRQVWYAEKNNGMFGKGKAKKAYDSYVYYLEEYIRSEIELEAMTKLLTVLDKFRKQLEDKATNRYLKFNRIMNNLISTFKENQQTLNGATSQTNKDLFAIPLITINEIRPTLDAEVEKMNMPGMMAQFVGAFFANEDVWKDEDENKISRLVKDFFINQAFSSFAGRSITQFLADKYHTESSQEITNKLFKEYMVPLKDRSQALFPVDASVWDDSVTSEIAYISVPSTADVVVKAAEQLHRSDQTFSVKKSALKDRIYIMRCSVALPISAYANCELYEEKYFTGKQEGRHYYIGKGGSRWFNNWQNLPSLIPQSLIEGHTPPVLQTILDDSRNIYKKATEAGLIREDSILSISDLSRKKIADVEEYTAKAVARAEGNTQSQLILEDAKGKVKAVKDSIEFVETGYSIPKGSIATPAIENTIRLDYFVSSPAYQAMLKEDLEVLSGLTELVGTLEEKIGIGGVETRMLKGFSQALFSGVIVWNRLKVTYTKTEFGIPSEVTLSDFTQKVLYPYAMLPLYQAFLTFKKLGEEERNDIINESEQRIGAFDDACIESIKAYKEKITPEFNANFVNSAKATPEILQDATSFIRGLNTELQALVATARSLGLL